MYNIYFQTTVVYNAVGNNQLMTGHCSPPFYFGQYNSDQMDAGA